MSQCPVGSAERTGASDRKKNAVESLFMTMSIKAAEERRVDWRLTSCVSTRNSLPLKEGSLSIAQSA